MADRIGNGETKGLRAWTAPVRGAVTRMWGGTFDESLPEEPGRSGIVDCAVYVDGVRREGALDYRAALEAARAEPNAFVWLGLNTPRPEEMAGIADAFGLHELAVDDVINAGQRPKLERYEDFTFLVLRSARYIPHEALSEHAEVVETGQVMLLIGDRFVITVRHGEACTLRGVRKELEGRPELLRLGTWAVAYAVTDHVVDLYVDASERLEDDLDLVEEKVFSREGTAQVQQIYQLKREMVEFKRAVLPLQRPIMALVGESSEVGKELRRYFRDVQDHLTRTVEQIAGFDDLLNSILQARLAQVSVEQNNDMRKIASWAGIAAFWTAVAGIYGMNFDKMPELHWQYGYPIIFAVMVGGSLLLFRLFRRSGWL
ncbi:magnesium transporter [Hamadaea flava]|uniref:Magnesium transport protein CorA n=1 Tax=Hamadaea flava TaxID=1742688 RepID=A0ABV8LFC5_9ACTN|nr:magnesium/cobalt transporter CorA [Hamadaea flava]MCP2326166.1 magnesium transporter [Hamadaea flava]